MANKIFNYRYRASAPASVTDYGVGNFNVNDVSSYNSISSLVNTTAGSQERFAYSLVVANETSIYEYGIGYLTALGGGLYQFNRETPLSSSQGDNSKVNILASYGAVTIDVVAPNNNYSNYERINSSTGLTNVNSTYFIDATGNLTLSLPEITTDSVVIGLTITSLSGSENERTDAVTLDADGTDTIDGTGTYSLSKKNDFIRIISDIENSNWIVLDPISEAAASSGPDGAVQLADGGVLGYDAGLFYNDDYLWIGGSGESTAAVKISESGSVFNIQSGDIDFTINSNGVSNTFFVDGSSNSVGINTNSPSDLLNISTTGIEGITISTSTSGSIPTLSFQNNDPDFAEGLDIGRIDFIGSNSADENITYARIISEASDETDGSEEGLVKLLVNNNGTLQIVSLLTYSDIQIGPNNSISGGLIIGANNTNKGDNVCVGYYSTNCGTSSINIGHQNTIESGSYAGAIGTAHTVTGSHIWLIGGSGADITGTNSTYLIGNDNNYIKIKYDQQQRAGIYIDSTGTDFNVVNTRISLSGTEHKQSIVFNNSSGNAVTGVSYGVRVIDPSDSNENTRFFVRVLESGVQQDVLSMSTNNVNISNLSGIDNSVFIGSNLAITGDGANITVIGLSNIASNNSGENTIVGYNNELTTSGNDHIVVVGNSNTIDENYSTTVGSSNSNSGLYSAVVGYNNGLYGENISIVGVNNDVSGNNSTVLGYQNNVDNNGVYIIGQGNTSAFSGVHILGNDVVATGHNTTYIKNNIVVITGSYITFDTTGTINFEGTPSFGGFEAASSGDNVSIFVNDAGYITGEAYVTGISYDGSGELVLSTHSGSVTGILTDVVHSGDNISILVNDTGYLASGIDNVSYLINDTGYITSADYANPKLTFYLTNTGTNSIIFSGAGTQGAGLDETPDLYLYKGFTYAFDCDLGFPFKIWYPNGVAYTSGLTNNTGVTSGIVTWSVRHDTPSGLFYVNANSPLTISGNIYVV